MSTEVKSHDVTTHQAAVRAAVNPSLKPNHALIEAVKAGNHREVRRLVEEGADVNACDDYRATPLLWALFNRHPDVAAFLVERGADVNYAEFAEGHPLIYAVEQPETLTLLISSGADVNLRLSLGGETALHAAAAANAVEGARILIFAGADVNARVNSDVGTHLFSGGAKLWSETPLHFAAAYADRELIEALLNAGADPSLPNAHGELPAAYAGRHRRPEEVLELLR
jgi:ankyrin repeat protein